MFIIHFHHSNNMVSRLSYVCVTERERRELINLTALNFLLFNFPIAAQRTLRSKCFHLEETRPIESRHWISIHYCRLHSYSPPSVNMWPKRESERENNAKCKLKRKMLVKYGREIKMLAFFLKSAVIWGKIFELDFRHQNWNMRRPFPIASVSFHFPIT